MLTPDALGEVRCPAGRAMRFTSRSAGNGVWVLVQQKPPRRSAWPTGGRCWPPPRMDRGVARGAEWEACRRLTLERNRKSWQQTLTGCPVHVEVRANTPGAPLQRA